MECQRKRRVKPGTFCKKKKRSVILTKHEFIRCKSYKLGVGKVRLSSPGTSVASRASTIAIPIQNVSYRQEGFMAPGSGAANFASAITGELPQYLRYMRGSVGVDLCFLGTRVTNMDLKKTGDGSGGGGGGGGGGGYLLA